MAASAGDMSHATTVPSVLQPQSVVNSFYIVAVFDFVILIFFSFNESSMFVVPRKDWHPPYISNNQ